MAETLPKRIGAVKIEILKLIEQHQGGLVSSAILEGLPNHDPLFARQNIHHLANLEYLHSKKKPGETKSTYSISAKGKHLLKHVEDVIVTPDKNVAKTGEPKPRAKAGTKAKGKAKGKGKGKTIDDIVPIEAPLNVSTTAVGLMDQINRVIDENAKYREAMTRAAHQLATFLGMRLVPIAGPAEPAEPEQQ